MTFSIRKSGAWATPGTVKRRASGAWTGVQTIKRRVSGAWVTVWSALSAVVSPAYQLTTTRSASATLTSTAFTCTAAGATGAVSYAWEYVSGDTTVSCLSPTAASTMFRVAVNQATPSKGAVWRCKVTDAGSGAVTYSNDAQANFASTYAA